MHVFVFVLKKISVYLHVDLNIELHNLNLFAINFWGYFLVLLDFGYLIFIVIEYGFITIFFNIILNVNLYLDSICMDLYGFDEVFEFLEEENIDFWSNKFGFKRSYGGYPLS